MKTWLKGGLIGLTIAIILLSSYFALFYDNGYYCTRKSYNPVMCTFQSIIMTPLAIFSLPVASFLMPPKSGNFLWSIIFIVYQSIILFLIGSLIGFIVGKIKSRKQGVVK